MPTLEEEIQQKRAELRALEAEQEKRDAIGEATERVTKGLNVRPISMVETFFDLGAYMIRPTWKDGAPAFEIKFNDLPEEQARAVLLAVYPGIRQPGE